MAAAAPAAEEPPPAEKQMAVYVLVLTPPIACSLAPIILSGTLYDHVGISHLDDVTFSNWA